MSILDWLRAAQSDDAKARGDTETVRRIVGELDRLDPAHARYLAAFAYVLSRVANADLDITSIFERLQTSGADNLTGFLPDHRAHSDAEFLIAVHVEPHPSRKSLGVLPLRAAEIFVHVRVGSLLDQQRQIVVNELAKT